MKRKTHNNDFTSLERYNYVWRDPNSTITIDLRQASRITLKAQIRRVEENNYSS